MSQVNPYQSPPESSDPAATPNLPLATDEPRGLGGWLILVGIGVVLSPIRMIYSLAVSFYPVFFGTNAGGPLFAEIAATNPSLATLLIFEVLANIAFIIAYSILAVGFFRKRRWFPKAFIAIALANLVFILGDSFLAASVLNIPMDMAASSEIRRSLIGVCIWVPYMLRSRRVKNTFVEPTDELTSPMDFEKRFGDSL